MNNSLYHVAASRTKHRPPASPSLASKMRPVIATIAFFVAPLGIGAALDALTAENIAVGLVLLGIKFLFQAVRPRRRLSRTVSTIGPRPLAGAFVRGALAGVIFAAIMAVVLPLVALVPTPTAWSDWDRGRVENDIDTLVAAGNFEAAAKVIERRLPQRMSKAWRTALQQRHVDLWIAAGDATTTPEAKAACWQRAGELARQYEINARLADSLVTRIQAEVTHERSITDVRRGQLDQLRQLVTAIIAIDSPAARDALLRAIEQLLPRDVWPERLPQLIVDNLLRWADAASSLDIQRERLQAVVTECSRRRLDDRLAQLKLSSVQAELARMAPRALPKETRGRLLNLYNAEPAIVFDVSIESAGGMFLDNLAAKDFTINGAGQPVRHEVKQTMLSTATDLSVVVLLDYSPSTRLIRAAAQTGVIALASSAPQGTKFRILGFHEAVVPVTDWTSHFAEIDSRLRSFQTPGVRTDLGRAIETGVAELRGRSGTKALVIFTDGRDTSGAPRDYTGLIASCRANGIRVLAIGLENPDLDSALLAKLASETGGKYVTASRQEELVERFRVLRLEKTTPIYRIGLLTTPEMRWPLQLTVGGGDRPLRIELPQQLPR